MIIILIMIILYLVILIIVVIILLPVQSSFTGVQTGVRTSGGFAEVPQIFCNLPCSYAVLLRTCLLYAYTGQYYTIICYAILYYTILY